MAGGKGGTEPLVPPSPTLSEKLAAGVRQPRRSPAAS